MVHTRRYSGEIWHDTGRHPFARLPQQHPSKKEHGQIFYSKFHFDLSKISEQESGKEYYTVREAMEKFKLARDSVYSILQFHQIPREKAEAIRCRRFESIVNECYDFFDKYKRKVLYIDTEQGCHHCQQVLWRILSLAGLPMNRVLENLKMMSLRKFTPKMRLLIVEEAIDTIPDLGLVIIDGIRDFL